MKSRLTLNLLYKGFFLPFPNVTPFVFMLILVTQLLQCVVFFLFCFVFVFFPLSLVISCRCQGAEAFEIQQSGLANGIFMKFLKERLLEDKKITVLLDEVAEGELQLTTLAVFSACLTKNFFA